MYGILEAILNAPLNVTLIVRIEQYSNVETWV